MIALRAAWERPCRPPEGQVEGMLLLALRPAEHLTTLHSELCIALDVSGSMQGRKLQAAIEACHAVYDCLHATDAFSLLAFGTTVTEVIPRTEKHAMDRRQYERCLAGLKAAGVTRTGLALERSQALLKGMGGNRVVVLVTDGHPTDKEGRIAPLRPFFDQAEQLRHEGIGLVTVGLGDARFYHAPFLTALADLGKGQFCYAPHVEELQEVLGEQIETLRRVVVTNVELAFVSRRAHTVVTDMCRIAPAYMPIELATTSHGVVGSCGHLPHGETTFLAKVKTHGRFGLAAAEYPVFDVAVRSTEQQNTLGATTVSLRYSALPKEQQQINQDVRQLRLQWDLNLYNDALQRTDNPQMTAQLLDALIVTAGVAGRADLVKHASEQREYLQTTGTVSRHSLTQTGQLVRSASGLVWEQGREGLRQKELGVGFGGHSLSSSLAEAQVGGDDAAEAWHQVAKGSGALAGDQVAKASSSAPSGSPTRLQMDVACLQVVEGSHPGERIPLNQVRLVVGRSSPAAPVDVDLSHQERASAPKVSRRHAEFNWDNGKLLLGDLGSTHGTYVNGVMLSPSSQRTGDGVELALGDTVRFADLVFRVAQLGDEEPRQQPI